VPAAGFVGFPGLLPSGAAEQKRGVDRQAPFQFVAIHAAAPARIVAAGIDEHQVDAVARSVFALEQRDLKALRAQHGAHVIHVALGVLQWVIGHPAIAIAVHADQQRHLGRLVGPRDKAGNPPRTSAANIAPTTTKRADRMAEDLSLNAMLVT